DGAVDRGAVAELAVEIVTPALDRAGGGERARLLGPGSDGEDTGGEAHHVHRDRTARGGAVAELAILIVPPALDRANGGQGARMGGPGEGREDTGGEARYAHGERAVGLGAIAELTPAIVAPALDRARGGNGAGELPSCAEPHRWSNRVARDSA